jgi:uncharacterized metal-binding protein YceD (DUF177 family)
MAKLGPFQVPLRELPAHRRFEVGPELVAEWLAGHPMRDALEGAGAAIDGGAADLELYGDGADGTTLFATGTFRGQVAAACSRCVNPVALPIEEALRVTFVPAPDLPDDDDDDDAKAKGKGKGKPDDEAPEDEVSADELDVFGYHGDVLDLEPLLREQFVLAIPFAPLCAETCKGLCPQCGIDRNSATCACEAPIDPRLAPLKGLKLPS